MSPIFFQQTRTILSPDSIKIYDNLYVHLRGQFGGDQTSSLCESIRLDEKFQSGYPFIRIFDEIATGTYEMKAPKELALHSEFFLPELLQSVRLAERDQKSNGSLAQEQFLNIFRRSGTHYVSGGTFGGLYEIHVHRGNCKPDVENGRMKSLAFLSMEDIGICAYALIKRGYQVSFFMYWVTAHFPDSEKFRLILSLLILD